jgi:transcriptional regulator with XRE-family HTH domain
VASGVDPEALRAARERAGLTQHELARRIGVAGGERISRWELGTSEPRPELLARLGLVLETAPRSLLRLDGGSIDLRALRFAAGVSVAVLAGSADISKPTYLRWESGRWGRLPSQEVLGALAEVLSVRVSEVVAALEHSRALLQAAQDEPIL